MTIGLVVLGLAMAQPAPPPAAVPLIPSFFTAGTIYEICTRPNAGQCSMYVAGALDGMFLVEAERDAPSFCLPKMTNQKAAELVVDYLEDNPAARNKAAAAAIYEVFEASFPCPSPKDEAGVID